MLTASWDGIGPGARLGMLIAATAVLGLLLRPLTRRAPIVTRMFELLFAVLVPLDVAALALTLGGGWPTASFTAGAVGLVSGTLFRFHLGPRTRLADGGLILAGGAVGIGVAALVGTSAALIVGLLAALAIVVAPWRNASVGWATLAGLAPIALTIDGSTIVGQGTLTRAGLLGDAVGFGAPAAALLAGAVFVYFFLGSQDARYLGATTVALGLGSIATWAHYDPPTSGLLPAAAAVFLLVELLSTGIRRPDLTPLVRRWAEGFEFGVGPLLSCIVLGRTFDTLGGEANQTVFLAAAWMTIGWLLASVRIRSMVPVAGAVLMAASGLAALQVDPFVIGSLLAATGAAWIIGTWRRGTTASVMTGALTATVGIWTIAVDVEAAGLTIYVAPLAAALLLVGERQAMNSWAHWPASLTLLTIAALQGHDVTGLDRHLTFLTLCGVGAAALGAARSQAAPLLLGTAIAITVGGYQLLDVTVGLAAWGWLSIAGATLLAIAALLEVTALPAEEHPAHLLEDITTRFR